MRGGVRQLELKFAAVTQLLGLDAAELTARLQREWLERLGAILDGAK